MAGVMLAVVAGGPAFAQQARYAERGATGGYGGGLIEFLVTGRADRPTATGRRQPGRRSRATGLSLAMQPSRIMRARPPMSASPTSRCSVRPR